MKYVYSAVFTQVDDGYSVELPDLQGREAILKVHAKKIRLGP